MREVVVLKNDLVKPRMKEFPLGEYTDFSIDRDIIKSGTFSDGCKYEAQYVCAHLEDLFIAFYVCNECGTYIHIDYICKAGRTYRAQKYHLKYLQLCICMASALRDDKKIIGKRLGY